MSSLIQTGNKGWYVSVSPPASFGYKEQAAFQKRIDAIAGTKDSRPLIKLAWAPDELRWMPHRMGDDAPGYVYPIFCTGRNEDGQFVAPRRWVLLERIEPEQYSFTWEAKRYINWHGVVWDVKGPCPSEKYVELRCHSYHDGECCPCLGEACECGEKYDHCWGRYAEPNERLLDWIRWTVWESKQDSDVKPTEDERTFTAPNAQRELVAQVAATAAAAASQFDDLDKDVTDYWERKPHSVTKSGIVLLNQST